LFKKNIILGGIKMEAIKMVRVMLEAESKGGKVWLSPEGQEKLAELMDMITEKDDQTKTA
jgi:hypothetical protein